VSVGNTASAGQLAVDDAVVSVSVVSARLIAQQTTASVQISVTSHCENDGTCLKQPGNRNE